MHCDIHSNYLYLQGYRCNSTCQAEPQIKGIAKHETPIQNLL